MRARHRREMSTNVDIDSEPNPTYPNSPRPGNAMRFALVATFYPDSVPQRTRLIQLSTCLVTMGDCPADDGGQPTSGADLLIPPPMVAGRWPVIVYTRTIQG